MVIEGIIRPPPEIRAVADRTALYVAKNGRAFEARILNSEKGKTPKFAFLQMNSPFHAYYEQRISFYESNENEEKEKQQQEQKKHDEGKNDEKQQQQQQQNGEAETGAGEDKNGNKSQQDQKPVRIVDKKQKASIVDPIAKALLSQRSKVKDYMTNQPKDNSMGDDDGKEQQGGGGIVLPPKPILARQQKLVNIVAPSSLSVAQVELIQLVAQFTALDDTTGIDAPSGIANNTNKKIGFLSRLIHREWNNPKFAFCQPRHGHFAYFTSLVDAYKDIIKQWTTSTQHQNQIANLPSAKKGINENNTNEDKSKSSDGNNNDNDAHATQNSHNFLNTIINSNSSMAIAAMANNPKQCLQVAAYHVEYDRQIETIEREQQEKQQQEEGEISGGAMNMSTLAAAMNQIDWHDFVVVETIDFPPDEVVELSMKPPPPSSLLQQQQIQTQPTSITNNNNNNVDAMEESDNDEDMEDDDEPIRVVPSYTPKVVSTQQQQAKAGTMAIDPITGQSIPVADMPEHMRIQLLDPKWAEERKKFQEKQKDSNFVSGDVIASNISRFVKDGDSGSQHQLGLEQANRIMSDQAKQQQQLHQQQRPMSGPTLPPPNSSRMSTTATTPTTVVPLPPPPGYGNINANTVEPPASKRQRLGEGGMMNNNMYNSNMMSNNMPPHLQHQQLQQPQTSPPKPPITTILPPPPPPPPPTYPAAATNQETDNQQPPNTSIETAAKQIFNAAVAGGTTTTDTPPAAAVTTTTDNNGGNATSSDVAMTTTDNSGGSNNSITLQIRIPNDPSQMAWNFYGQILSLSVQSSSQKVKQVKQELSRLHLNGMPLNKIQLKSHALGIFLKDNLTLQESNIGPKASGGTTLEMIPRKRGARK